MVGMLGKLLEIMGSVGLAFVPPHEDLDLSTAHGKKLYDWRTIMAGGLTATIWLVILHMVWTSGVIPNTGYAKAADTNRILAKQIAAQIYERKKDYCASDQGSRARQQHWTELESMRMEYENLTGERYNEPDCESL